mgnify:CR=1 FL=1
MKTFNKFSRQTFLLLLLGTLLIGLPFFIKGFLNMPEDLIDFLKGIGVAFVFSSLFFLRKTTLKNQ